MQRREKSLQAINLFRARVNDYKKAQTEKPLIHDFSFFTRTEAPSYGGSALGPFKKNGEKTYYLARHQLEEYFALEVLLRIGIHTPKARFITQQGQLKKMIATRSVDGYIPMLAVRHDLELKFMGSMGQHKDIIKLREQYRMDISQQVIIDLKENKKYKISGNLFASDIAAILINDPDFQQDLCNLGLVRAGNRFYAVAIDKDKAQFNGYDYDMIVESIKPMVLSDSLYALRTQDQELSIVYEITCALMHDGTHQSDFDRIFLNPRVEASCLSLDTKKRCANLKETAFSLVTHYHDVYGSGYLKAYQEREEIRMTISRSVIEKIKSQHDGFTSDFLLRLLVEDLRGPYYHHLFVDQAGLISEKDLSNNALLDALELDILNEFNLVAEQQAALRCL